MNHKLLFVVGIVAFAPACKKTEATQPTDKAAKADKPAAATGPFADWDMAGRKAAFQGAMVGPGGSVGRWEAWNVEGNKITIWDGKTEQVAELELPSPCEAVVVVKSGGGSSSTTHHYTLEA